MIIPDISQNGTPEIAALAMQDSRFEKTIAWINDHWNGYHPALRLISCDVRDAHDIDALEQPMLEAMTQISRDNPETEILINLTSGTPQMQMILSQLAMDIRYRARGVQVSNYEKKSGSGQRTNEKEYDVELELAFNEDELPEAENRCTEPRMLAVRREYLRRQIMTLLDERDFEAVEALKDDLPEELRLASQIVIEIIKAAAVIAAARITAKATIDAAKIKSDEEKKEKEKEEETIPAAIPASIVDIFENGEKKPLLTEQDLEAIRKIVNGHTCVKKEPEDEQA